MSPTPDDVSGRLQEIHYAIFRHLPEEGRQLGLTPMVATVVHIRSRINETLPTGERVTSAVLQAELRGLKLFGYAHRVTTLAGATKGWQRTKLATEALRAHDRELAAAEVSASEEFSESPVASEARRFPELDASRQASWDERTTGGRDDDQ